MSVPSWARAGVVVECVNSELPPGYEDRSWSLQCTRYVVLAVVPRSDNAISAVADSSWGVVLRGCPNPFMANGAFNINRFRPLVATKTEAEDVALFTDHLKAPRSSTTKRERADV